MGRGPSTILEKVRQKYGASEKFHRRQAGAFACGAPQLTLRRYLRLTLDLRTATNQNCVVRCRRLCPERQCYTKPANDDDTRGLPEPLLQWL